MSEASSPNLPAIGPGSKAESGTSNVSVNVGSTTGGPEHQDHQPTKALKEYWPIILFLISVVFSAGVLWQKVDTLEERQAKFETTVTEQLNAISKKIDDIPVINWGVPAAKTNDF